MAEYDGSIRFNTKLDTSEFEAGINKLQTSSLQGTGAIKTAAENNIEKPFNKTAGSVTKSMLEISSALGPKVVKEVSGLATVGLKVADILDGKLDSGLAKTGEGVDLLSIAFDAGTAGITGFVKGTSMGGPQLGILLGSVSALGVGVTELGVQLNDNMTVYDALHEKNDTTIQQLNDEKTAWNDVQTSAQASIGIEQTKIDQAIKLKDELLGLADATGHVSETEVGHAQTILGQLNQAFGTQFTMTGNMIDNYDTLKQTIDNVTDASRARATVEGAQQIYQQAEIAYSQKRTELAEQEVAMNKTLDESARISAELRKAYQEKDVANITRLKGEQRELAQGYKDQQQVYEETEKQADGYRDVMTKIDAITNAIATGSAEDVNNAVAEFQNTIKTGNPVMIDSAKAIELTGNTLEICKEKYQKAQDDFTKGIISKEELDGVKQELLTAADSYVDVGGTMLSQILAGLQTGDEQLLTGLAAIAGVSVDTLKQSLGIQSPSSVMSSEVGVPMVQGITAGAQSESGILNAAMRKIVRDAITAAKDEGVIESPSHVMRDEVGLMFSKGLAMGITDGKDEVVSAAEGVANAAISAASSISAADVLAKLSDSFINGLKENDKGNTEKYQDKLEILDYKQAFGGLSTEDYYAEMERLRDQYLTAYTKEWFDATEKIYDHQKEMAEEARDKALDELDKQHDKGLMSEAQYIAELTAFRDRYYAEGTEEYAEMTEDIAKLSRENELDMLDFHYDMGLLTEQDYYQKLLEYRDKHFAVGSAEWMEYTKKICSYNKSQIQKAYDEIAEYAGKKLSDLLSKQEALYGKLDGYGSLMKTVTVKNYYEDGSDLQFNELNDISKDNDFLRQYNENITAAAQRLKASGLDEAAAAKLYDELLGMSPEEASDFAALLTKATDEEFEKYLADYKENMDLLDEVSKNPFREEWKEATEKIVSELKEAGFEVPEAFSDIGEDSAMEFSRSFLEELQTQMEDIKTQITGWSFTLVPQVVGASANGESRVFSPTYHLYGSGETDVQRIQSAKAISEQHRMAGGY